jgi:autotransporter-associated beta strand protein
MIHSYKRRPSPPLWPILCAIAVAACAPALRAQNLAAFPGAVGFGGTASGATTLSVSGTSHAGGNVYHVTNLNDSGAGSFRTGVSTSGNIVVFDVGGNIHLLSAVSAASNLTIAGQTAPGGIQVFGAETSFYGQSNIICRYIHFRDGTIDPNYPGSSATDSHTNAASLGNTTNVVMDHCSFEFAAYNNIDAVGAVNTTIQNCIFADPILEQQFNCHIETGPVTFIDNLWANSGGRNPLGKADLQFVNNIVYNWGFAMTTGNSTGTFDWDVIGNYFITGPNTNQKNDDYYQVNSGELAYATGNYEDTSKNGTLQGATANTVGSATMESSAWSPTTVTLPTLTATAAFYDVVSSAGPLPHDQVDSQVVTQTLSLGTQGRRFNTQTDTGLVNPSNSEFNGYGVIVSGTALPDSDASGMPDDWKAAMGLSMTNPAVSGYTSSTGYTNLENYLNWKAQPNTWVAKNTAAQPTSVSIDLSQYTNGFASGSTFTVTNVIKGAATQSGAGGYLVNFVPTSGSTGLGGFNWSVTNGVTTMTSTCGVLISQSGPAQSVTWKGNGVNNYWDLSTANWTSVSSGSAADFGAGDPVTFNDTGSISPAVNIDTAVSPGSITVNTYANNYTLSGSATISGSGTLVKEGTASLTINNSGGNSFSGGAILNSGTTYDYYSSSLGAGPISLNGGTLNLIASSTNYITISPTINVNVQSTLGVQGSNIYLTGTFNGSAPLTINFNSNIVCTPEGVWSGFSGQLNLANAGTFRLENAGFPNSIVNCEGAEYVTDNVSGTTTVSLGALEGVSSSNLTGGGPAGSSVVYSIGALNTPSVFPGTVSNGANQTVGITQAGTSTLTLSGNNTYTGPTSVSSGTLLLTGTLGNTDVTISSGANFISNTLVSGTVTLAGGSLYLGNSTTPGVIGTLTAGNAFVVDGGTIYYDLSSSPAATGSNDLITVTAGSLSLNDTINFEINLTNGVLGAGTYSLINGGATLGVSFLTMNLVLPIPAGGVTRQSFNLVRPASGSANGYLNLQVSGSAGSLTWSGTNGATWDLANTLDWNPATSGTFFDLDTVTFNDSDTGGTVSLSGTLAPNVAYVTNNVTNYSFTGTGGLAGNAVLIKSGSASLTINNTGNTFDGPIYLDGGTMVVNQYLGTGTIYLNGGTLVVGNGVYLGNSIVVDTTSTIDAQGGSDWLVDSPGATLSSTSAVTLYVGVGSSSAFTIANNMNGFQGIFELGSSSGLVRLNGSGSALALFDLGTSTAWMGNRNGGVTENFGAIQGGPGTTLSGRTTGSGNTASTYIIGALNTDNTFAGSIVTDGDLGGLNITKVGTGNWTLSGTSSFIGDFLVQQGTLTISGSDNNGGLNFETESGATLNLAGGAISTETVQIDQGAFFTGYGAINGSLVNEGTNSLNTASGTVTINGTLAVNGNIENDGTMTVASGGLLLTTLAVDGGATFVNNGTLDLRNSPQTALPYGYVNNGAILTSGSLLVIQALVWTGDGAANAWNLSAPNWTSMITGSAAAFSADDPITFTDGGSTSPAVNITTNVSPQSIEVSGSASNYTFSGAGGIGGAGGLEKDSTGALTLASANTYTGPTLLDSGTLQLQANSGNTVGGVSSALSLSSTLTLGAGTTLGLYGNTNNTIFAPASVGEADSNGPFNFSVGNNGSGTGNTLILANVGQFGYPATAPAFNLSGANGYTLQLGSGPAGTGALYFYNNTVLNSNSPGVTLSIPGGMIINYPASYTLTFGGAGNFSIGAIVPYSSTYTEIPTFAGTGTVALTGSNTYTGATTVTSGLVHVTGQITATPTIAIGSTSGVAAALYQLGTNSLISITNGAGGAFQMGGAAGAFGYFNLSGGTVAVPGEIDTGGYNGGAGTFGEFDMSGGTISLPNSAASYFLMNRGLAGESSVFNISGGTVEISGGGAPANGNYNGLVVNWAQTGAAQVATITISGSGQFLIPSITVKLNNGGNTTTLNAGSFNGTSGNSANVANLNLNSGGLLQTLGFHNGTSNNGNVYINFNGGTLEAGNAANSAYLANLGGVYVFGGGGTFNNNGQAITIAQPLLAVTGSGVSSVAVSAAGAGYTVPPEITFSGGGGTGATAYATISATTGALTGIVVTNPGTGYTSAPGAALTGTTAGTSAVLGTVTMTANATTGAMVFTGTGATTLTAIEGYTGPTIVNSGTLALNNATNTNGTLHGTSSLTINNGATVSLGGADNSLFGAATGGVLATINAGGAMMTIGSVTEHLGNLTLAGGTLASGTPSGDGLYYGEYDLDYGVTAGGTSATSTISARDVALTEAGGAIFYVNPGSTSGIDLNVTGTFYHSTGSPDTGLVKTGNGVMVISGSSNYSSPTTVSAGTLGILGGALSTTAVAVTGSATLTLAGGAITTGTVQIGSSAFLIGYGTINGTLINSGTSFVEGLLTVNGNFQNNGTLLVTGSGTLVANLSNGGTFVNNGTLDIMDSPQTVLPAGYVNNGVILNSSLVTVQQVARSANTFSVTIQSYTNHTYQLEKSTNLTAWQNIGAAQSGQTGSVLVLTDTNAAGSSMFYQVGVGP